MVPGWRGGLQGGCFCLHLTQGVNLSIHAGLEGAKN